MFTRVTKPQSHRYQKTWKKYTKQNNRHANSQSPISIISWTTLLVNTWGKFNIKNIMNEHMGSTHVQKYYCKHCVNHLWIKIVLKQHRVLLNDENNTTVITVLATSRLT